MILMSKPTDFAYNLTNFLATYLSRRRNLSINTVKSYRDTFKLFLQYCETELKITSGRLTLEKFNKEMICDFTDWLGKKRNLTPISVNQRLGAIHSFCKYLQTEDPTYIYEYQRILSIPYKKCVRPLVGFLSKEALKLILSMPDTKTKQGRRDLVLMSLLYDTGARVQELCDLCIGDLFLSENPYVVLTGKGNKTRYVPLFPNITELVRNYLKEFHYNPLCGKFTPLFCNKQQTKLTRMAITHVVKKYTDMAREKSSIIPPKVTPHIFRHTKAMHLCQAGVDMIYIRDILGHVLLSTTEIYAKINFEQMRDALENAYPELTDNNLPDWSNDDSLMGFLTSL